MYIYRYTRIIYTYIKREGRGERGERESETERERERPRGRERKKAWKAPCYQDI